MWHVTRDMWPVRRDTWHVTCNMWHVVGGEHSLKISAPQLFWFVIYDILKIRRKRLTELINYLMSNKVDCRTAPATPCLLNIKHFVERSRKQALKKVSWHAEP